MKNINSLKAFFLLFLSISFSNAFGQPNNSVSSSPAPYCVGLTYTANVGTASEPGNDYNCLLSQPNPSWFFLKAQTAGDIVMELSAASDIDFIVYGPFSDFNNLLSYSGNLVGVEIDCSYSGTNIETVTIPTMNVGEYFLILITNYASIVQDITLIQTGGTGSLDCEVFNQTYHTISGQTFYDSNQNGSMEPGEYYLPNVYIQIDPISASTISNFNGEFFYSYYITDSIYYTVTSDMTDWNNTTPNPINFYLDTTITDTTLLFGFFPDSLYYSNSIDVINTVSNCVLTNISNVNVMNNGTLLNGGIIHFTLDSDLTFQSANYPVDSQIGNDIYFAFDTLLPFHNLPITIYSVPSISLAIGDTISSYAEVTIIDSMLNLQNTFQDTILLPVACSYDPNLKIALPNGAYGIDNIIEPNDKMEYLILFQNTGTAPALNVQVKDQLSASFDYSTFEFLSASHNAFVSIDSSGFVVFDFQNINLPDSNSNEPLSHGYVKFSIALDSTVLPNDVVTNDANIYFDNNSPITTNSTINVLDCFILPVVNFTYAAQLINTNLSIVDYTFTWMLDGNVLAGETNNFINCTADGVYTVTVKNNYGCIQNASYFYSSAGVTSNSLNNAVIFPNPSESNFGIYLSENGNYQITIVDESGRLILSDLIFDSNSYTIESNVLKPGVYFIQITPDDHVSSFYRIVKL